MNAATANTAARRRILIVAKTAKYAVPAVEGMEAINTPFALLDNGTITPIAPDQVGATLAAGAVRSWIGYKVAPREPKYSVNVALPEALGALAATDTQPAKPSRFGLGLGVVIEYADGTSTFVGISDLVQIRFRQWVMVEHRAPIINEVKSKDATTGELTAQPNLVPGIDHVPTAADFRVKAPLRMAMGVNRFLRIEPRKEQFLINEAGEVVELWRLKREASDKGVEVEALIEGCLANGFTMRERAQAKTDVPAYSPEWLASEACVFFGLNGERAGSVNWVYALPLHLLAKEVLGIDVIRPQVAARSRTEVRSQRLMPLTEMLEA